MGMKESEEPQKPEVRTPKAKSQKPEAYSLTSGL
jgi:hypothetical protein